MQKQEQDNQEREEVSDRRFADKREQRGTVEEQCLGTDYTDG